LQFTCPLLKREGVLFCNHNGGNLMALKIALPTGSLQAQTIKLFSYAGMAIAPPHPRQQQVMVEDSTIRQVIWLNPRDIPHATTTGVADVGLTGSDCWEEYLLTKGGSRVTSLNCTLPYSKSLKHGSKLALIASEHEFRPEPRWNEPVVSDYPRITAYAMRSPIVPVRGGVEGYIPQGYNFGVTLVETGASLLANGLKIVRVLRECAPAIYQSSLQTRSAELLATSLAHRLKDAYQVWE
jgi:ATP phosphoribosyltransferase